MWIGHASRLLRRELDQRIAETDVGKEDFVSGRNVWVLRYLKDHEGEEISQRDLEKKFRVRGSTISNMVDLMEQKGLIARAPSEKDARRKRLYLTEKAEAVLESVSETIRRFEAQLRDSFAPKDYELFLGFLERFCNVLEPSPETDDNQ